LSTTFIVVWAAAVAAEGRTGFNNADCIAAGEVVVDEDGGGAENGVGGADGIEGMNMEGSGDSDDASDVDPELCDLIGENVSEGTPE
jgi:hypothetical protein